MRLSLQQGSVVNKTKFFRPSFALLGVAAVVSLSACRRDGATTGDQSQANAAISAAPDGSQANLIETIYVPGPDDKLHPKPVSFKSIEVPASALQEVISSSPKWYPKDAKVNSITEDEKQITVDVNKNFSQQSFWGENGEKTTELGVYAIVNSASGKSKKPVQITVEKEPMTTLGDFDASDAIEPQLELIVGTPAPKKTPASSVVKPTKTPVVPTPVPPTAKQVEPTTIPRSE